MMALHERGAFAAARVAVTKGYSATERDRVPLQCVVPVVRVPEERLCSTVPGGPLGGDDLTASAQVAVSLPITHPLDMGD